MSSERRNIRVYVVDHDIEDSIIADRPTRTKRASRKGWVYNWEHDTLHEVIGWLERCLLEVPKEYRHKARIEIKSECFYDSPSTSIQIHYERPETDEEMDKRIAKVKADEERDKASELALLESLKKKYEG